MALLFCDSFDYYTTSEITRKWSMRATSQSVDSGIAASQGRTGGALRWGDGVSESGAFSPLQLNVTPATTSGVWGFAFKANSALFTSITYGTWGDWLHIRQPNDNIALSFKLLTNGLITAYKGWTNDGSPLGTTSGVPIVADTWQYVELKWTIHDTAGALQIKINGTSVLNLSGIDTLRDGTAGWTAISVAGNTHVMTCATSGCQMWLDDMYLLDTSGSLNTDFLGDVTVEAHLPNANGATSEWTRSTGADDYAVIDEATVNDDTDYLSTETLNAVTTVGVANAPAGAEILGVQVNAQVKKTGVGSPALASVVRHSGTDYPATGVGVASTGYLNIQFPYDANPGTGVAWTESGFNDAEFGVKKTA